MTNMIDAFYNLKAARLQATTQNLVNYTGHSYADVVNGILANAPNITINSQPYLEAGYSSDNVWQFGPIQAAIDVRNQHGMLIREITNPNQGFVNVSFTNGLNGTTPLATLLSSLGFSIQVTGGYSGDVSVYLNYTILDSNGNQGPPQTYASVYDLVAALRAVDISSLNISLDDSGTVIEQHLVYETDHLVPESAWVASQI